MPHWPRQFFTAAQITARRALGVVYRTRSEAKKTIVREGIALALQFGLPPGAAI